MNCFNVHRRRTDPKLDRTTRERVIQALRDGQTNDWIIANIGTCRQTITRIMKKHPEIKRTPGRKRK